MSRFWEKYISGEMSEGCFKSPCGGDVFLSEPRGSVSVSRGVRVCDPERGLAGKLGSSVVVGARAMEEWLINIWSLEEREGESYT